MADALAHEFHAPAGGGEDNAPPSPERSVRVKFMGKLEGGLRQINAELTMN